MIRGWMALGALWLAGCGPNCIPGAICEIAGTGELGFNGEGLDALDTKLASPTSVLTDPQDRMMVVDYSNMLVRVLDDDGTLQSMVGKNVHSFSEIGADALDTPLENPVDASWGPDGLLYILAQHEGRVIRVGEDGRIELYAGSGVLADGPGGVPAVEAEMGYGGGMAWGPDGSLYVSDSTYSRVRRFTPDGSVEIVLGRHPVDPTDEVGEDTGDGGIVDDAPASLTAEGDLPAQGEEVRYPERLVVDAARDRLIVADTGNHRVVALDLQTGVSSVLAGTGQSGFAGDGGPATEAQLSGPVGVEVTADGSVIIADLNNDVLRLVTADGTIETVAGDRDGETPRSWGDPLEFPMRRPAGLAWTAEGDLLIAERGGHRVLRWVGAADAL